MSVQYGRLNETHPFLVHVRPQLTNVAVVGAVARAVSPLWLSRGASSSSWRPIVDVFKIVEKTVGPDSIDLREPAIAHDRKAE